MREGVEGGWEEAWARAETVTGAQGEAQAAEAQVEGACSIRQYTINKLQWRMVHT